MDATTTAELTIRMVVGLAVVLGLLAFGARLARRRVGQTKAVDIDVCGRQVLTKASSIAVVRVGERHLLLGVNDSGVSLLAEGDDLAASRKPANATSSRSTSIEPLSTVELPQNSSESVPATTPTPTSASDDDNGAVVDIRNNVIEALRQRTVRRQ